MWPSNQNQRNIQLHAKLFLDTTRKESGKLFWLDRSGCPLQILEQASPHHLEWANEIALHIAACGSCVDKFGGAFIYYTSILYVFGNRLHVTHRLQYIVPCLMPWIFFIVPPCSTHSVVTLLHQYMQAPLPKRLDAAFLLTLRTLHSQLLTSPVPAEWTGRPVAEYLVEEKERRQRAKEELEKSIKLVEVWLSVFVGRWECCLGFVDCWHFFCVSR